MNSIEKVLKFDTGTRMNHFPLDEMIKTIQTKTYRHTEGIFEVCKEIASGTPGQRMKKLVSGGALANLTVMYNSLPNDLRSLLILGILYHDITKPLKSVGHAAQAAKLVKPLSFKVLIQNTDIVNAMGGWQKKISKTDAKAMLYFLIKYHESLGNFFTGEQNLLGFFPLLCRLPMNLRPQFMDLLLLLTVAEVGSYGATGYLAQRKYDRYMDAFKFIKNIKTKIRADSRNKLYRISLRRPEIIKRLIGLIYAYAQDIDQEYPRYETSITHSLNQAKIEGSLTESFPDEFARITKLSYGLVWLDAISNNEQQQSQKNPIIVIRLLTLLCRVVKIFPKDMFFEFVFPANPDSDRLNRIVPLIKARLNDPISVRGADFGQFSKRHFNVSLWNDLLRFKKNKKQKNGIAVINVIIKRP
jgi:hypothetical protein